MKTKIIKFFTTNLALKVLGLVLATLLWLVLSNMQDSVVKMLVSVPIQYDETYLTENGYVVLEKNAKASVQVWARKSNISKVDADDFIASVDTSEFLGSKIKTSPDTTKFNLVITKKKSATYIEDWDYLKSQGQYLEMEVDKIKSELYTIGTNLTGEVPAGVRIDAGQIQITPQRVLVSGPTSHFGNLNSIRAIVDLSTLVLGGGVGTATAKLQMYDGNNRVLANTGLILGQDTVEVKVGVVASKTASVNVAGYMGDPASGYGCRDYDYEPKSVTIIGSEAALSQVTTISIPKAELDISAATGDMTFEIDMTKYLPAGISIAEDEPSSVSVTVSIEKLDEASFLLSTENLQMIGMNEDYEYEIISPHVEITLRAFKEDLTAERVSEAHLQGSINVTGIEPGDAVSLVPVLLSMDSRYSLVGDVQIEVMIHEKGADLSEPDETDSDTIQTEEMPVSEEQTEYVSEASSEEMSVNGEMPESTGVVE